MTGWSTGNCETNGINIHYTRTGASKPLLILLHGLAANGACWAAVAHVAAHEIGVAAYAIKAAPAATPAGDGECAGRLECRWQREQLPEAIRTLVLEDQRLRNKIRWSVFDC